MVLVGLVVVLAANFIFALYLQRDPVNPVNARVSDKWSLIDDPGGAVTWIVLGDSSCNQGIDPAVIEQSLGGRAINLCTTGNLLVADSAWALASFLDRHPPPTGVILGQVPDVWIREKRSLPQGLILSIPGLADAAASRPPDVGIDDGLLELRFRWLPTWTQRRSIQVLMQQPWRFLRDDTQSVAGYFAEPDDNASPSSVKSNASDHLSDLPSRGAVISSINQEALGVIGELASRYDFDVFLVTSPIYDGLWNDQDYREWIQATVASVGEVVDEYDRLQMVLCDPVPFPAELMSNADHVTVSAAERYSNVVSLAIRSGQRC